MEILFKAKRKDNEEWVYWNVFGEYTEPFMTEFESHSHVSEADVIPETVGQWTGETDRNENKIFDGDIINDIDYGIMICVYARGSFVFQSTQNRMFWIDLQRYVPAIEIIGNIHDNPELLKGDAE